MSGLWTDPAGPNRRHAPKSIRRKDEGARRWMLGSAMLAASVVLLVAGWMQWRNAGSLHPIGRPHRNAGLTCGSCHQDDEQPAARCSSCHGPHPSVRPGHRQLQRQGALVCTDCHRIHEHFGGVAFEGRQVFRFGPAGTAEVSLDSPRADLQGTVAVVAASACRRCHAPTATQDPLARCLDRTGAFSLCFDEHRRVAGETLGSDGTRDRLVLWALSREAVARVPQPPATARTDEGLLWALVALSVFLVVVGRRWWIRPARKARADAVDVRPPERVRLPRIDASTCLGCSACVDACPYDVLTLERYVAKVARPQDCCGLTTCEERCPNGSLVVHDGAAIEDRPGVRETLESLDVPGLYLAGDLTGMPLIRNAINQGAVAVDSIVRAGRRGEAEALDVVIVGAGPAGLSAALAAKKAGLRFVLLEQGDLAQSIRSFPRGKLVFDQPLSVPLIGDLWLAESTKEELLRHWVRIVRSEKLPLRTHHRVAEIRRDPGGFWIRAEATQGESTQFRAANVVLAIGRRGTPRQLPIEIAEDVQDRVFYSLADARTFAQRRCVVVGLGDVAMEATLALSYVPGSTVTVVARGADFTRGKARNIAAIRSAEAAGRLRVLWETTVTEVSASGVRVEGPEGSRTVPAEAVFVMIGAIAPWAFLASVGVKRRVGAKNAGPADPPAGSRVEPGHAGDASGDPQGIP